MFAMSKGLDKVGIRLNYPKDVINSGHYLFCLRCEGGEDVFPFFSIHFLHLFVVYNDIAPDTSLLHGQLM